MACVNPVICTSKIIDLFKIKKQNYCKVVQYRKFLWIKFQYLLTFFLIKNNYGKKIMELWKKNWNYGR